MNEYSVEIVIYKYKESFHLIDGHLNNLFMDLSEDTRLRLDDTVVHSIHRKLTQVATSTASKSIS